MYTRLEVMETRARMCVCGNITVGYISGVHLICIFTCMIK